MGWGELRKILMVTQKHDARKQPDVVTFTTLLSRLPPLQSLSLFSHLISSSRLRPNPHAFSAVLSACARANADAYSFGRQLHAFAHKLGAMQDVYVATALAHMYAKCGPGANMASPKQVFDEMPQRSVVSWNALLVGYARNASHRDAILAFRNMVRTPLRPDQVSVSSALRACANASALASGRALHGHLVKAGLGCIACVNNALLDMYMKCQCSREASKLFEDTAVRNRDVFTWTIAMLGCIQDGHFEEACARFQSMIKDGFLPDETSLATALHASAGLAASALGATIHASVIKTPFSDSRDLRSSLITMYSKCGRLEDAYRVFNVTKDHLYVVPWTAMITALQQHGHGDRAIMLFDNMLDRGIVPDHVTFISILSACSHNGLVDQGRKYFDSMRQIHEIIPGCEHYACMVDMLGRAGRLEEAKQFIDQMSIEPDASVLGALLGACRNYRDLELGKEVAEKLIRIEPSNPGNYVLLSNIYASHGRIQEAKEVRRLMNLHASRKETGCSWIDVEKKTHVFTVHQQSHPRMDEICETSRNLEELVKQEGTCTTGEERMSPHMRLCHIIPSI